MEGVVEQFELESYSEKQTNEMKWKRNKEQQIKGMEVQVERKTEKEVNGKEIWCSDCQLMILCQICLLLL